MFLFNVLASCNCSCSTTFSPSIASQKLRKVVKESMTHFALIVLVLAAAVLISSSTAKAKTTQQFMHGISGTTNTTWLSQVHATHCRRYIFWRHFEHELKELNTSLSVEAIRQHPDQEVYQWSQTHIDWSSADRQIADLHAVGVEPVIEVGEGTHYGLPKYNGTLADPGVIGMDLYLAYQYRFTRAVAHRYRKRGVQLFQIENELNEALLAGVYGQRLMTKPWGNWTFLTELLATLRQAVKDEDPSLQVTMNFHTDVPKIAHTLLHLPGFYLDAVRDWAPLLDVISYDAYPNMYVASPSLGHLVGRRLEATPRSTAACSTRSAPF